MEEKLKITEPVILISINQTYRNDMSPEELYNATRSSWKLGERRGYANFAFAVYQGIVQEVYRIDSWHRAKDQCDRWFFEGGVAAEPIRNKYIGESVKYYRKKGQINPVIFVNC